LTTIDSKPARSFRQREFHTLKESQTGAEIAGIREDFGKGIIPANPSVQTPQSAA
jgi:hypothetical protein